MTAASTEGRSEESNCTKVKLTLWLHVLLLVVLLLDVCNAEMASLALLSLLQSRKMVVSEDESDDKGW